MHIGLFHNNNGVGHTRQILVALVFQRKIIENLFGAMEKFTDVLNAEWCKTLWHFHCLQN